MFVGFIAVIVILLVVVATMSLGSKGPEDAAKYMTEAKNVQSLASHIRNETQFYYVKNNTFTGIGVDYFATNKFAQNKIVATSNMASADWEGWPAAEVGLADPYTGPYIAVGGTAGDNVRFIVTSLNGGNSVGLYMLKNKAATIPPAYLKALEQAMAQDQAYIGG